jgi:hypothetical protein
MQHEEECLSCAIEGLARPQWVREKAPKHLGHRNITESLKRIDIKNVEGGAWNIREFDYYI